MTTPVCNVEEDNCFAWRSDWVWNEIDFSLSCGYLLYKWTSARSTEIYTLGWGKKGYRVRWFFFRVCVCLCVCVDVRRYWCKMFWEWINLKFEIEINSLQGFVWVDGYRRYTRLYRSTAFILWMLYFNNNNIFVTLYSDIL